MVIIKESKMIMMLQSLKQNLVSICFNYQFLFHGLSYLFSQLWQAWNCALIENVMDRTIAIDTFIVFSTGNRIKCLKMTVYLYFPVYEYLHA